MRLMALFLSVVFSSFACAQGGYMSIEQVKDKLNNPMTFHENYAEHPMYKLNLQRVVPEKLFKPTEYKVEQKSWLKKLFESNNPIKDSVDLRFRDTPIKSQMDGHCTGYALTGIVENLINRNGKQSGLDMSDEHLWSTYRQYYMDSALRGYSNNKICDEPLFPQNTFKTDESVKPSSACLANAHAQLKAYKPINLSDIKQSLSNDNPVYIGFNVPKGMMNCQGLVTETTPVENAGHALGVMGYFDNNGETFLIIRNSWGAGCGDKGYHYVPVSYCQKSWCYFYEVSAVSSKYDSVTPTVVPPTVVPPTVIPPTVVPPTVTPTVVPTVVPTPVDSISFRIEPGQLSYKYTKRTIHSSVSAWLSKDSKPLPNVRTSYKVLNSANQVMHQINKRVTDENGFAKYGLPIDRSFVPGKYTIKIIATINGKAIAANPVFFQVTE